MIQGCGISMKDWLELAGITNLLKIQGGGKGVVRIIKREVKHSKLGTSVTRRMMPLRELQGRQNWERKGRDLTATELKMLVKGCWN